MKDPQESTERVLRGTINQSVRSGYLLSATDAGRLLSVLKSAAGYVQNVIDRYQSDGSSHLSADYTLSNLWELRGLIDNLPMVIIEGDSND